MAEVVALLKTQIDPELLKRDQEKKEQEQRDQEKKDQEGGKNSDSEEDSEKGDSEGKEQTFDTGLFTGDLKMFCCI